MVQNTGHYKTKCPDFKAGKPKRPAPEVSPGAAPTVSKDQQQQAKKRQRVNALDGMDAEWEEEVQPDSSVPVPNK